VTLLYRIVVCLFWIPFKLLYRLEIHGNEHLDHPGGAVIASSHTSFLDPPLLACAASTPLHFLARESLFNTAILSWALHRLNTHPVKGGSSLNSIRRVVGLIREGTKV